MRIAWAFDINPKAGAKWPVKPSEYAGFMPAMAGEDLPVTLRPRSEAKRAAIASEAALEKERHVPMRDLGTLQF